MDISVHDNQLISYSVFSQKREIHFHTFYAENNENTDVIFEKVFAYHFECDNFQTIIFDIDEVEFEEIYIEYENLFSRLKNYGWISVDYKSKKDLIQKLKEKNIKAYKVHSSDGLFGWVWAETVSKLNSRIQVNSHNHL